MTLNILDPNRQPIPCDDVTTWADWMASAPRKVGHDCVDRCSVHTTFTGTDLSVGLGRPLWFETMVFAPDSCLVLGRYSTWDEAAAGHEQVMAALRALQQDGQALTAHALWARLKGE